MNRSLQKGFESPTSVMGRLKDMTSVAPCERLKGRDFGRAARKGTASARAVRRFAMNRGFTVCRKTRFWVAQLFERCDKAFRFC